MSLEGSKGAEHARRIDLDHPARCAGILSWLLRRSKDLRRLHPRLHAMRPEGGVDELEKLVRSGEGMGLQNACWREEPSKLATYGQAAGALRQSLNGCSGDTAGRPRPMNGQGGGGEITRKGCTPARRRNSLRASEVTFLQE